MINLKIQKPKLNKEPETLDDIINNLKFLWEENKSLKREIKRLKNNKSKNNLNRRKIK
jgi:hypothetical protein